MSKDMNVKKENNMNTESAERKDLMREIMEDYRSGDKERKASAIERMVHANEGFIGVMIHRHYAPFEKEYYNDLFNEGVLAIIENMERYDPEKGTSTTFFTNSIRHAMSQFTNSLVNKSSAYFSSIMNKVRAANAYFEKENITPSLSDIALHTGLSVKKVEEGMRLLNATDEVRFETESDLDKAMNEFARTPEDEIILMEQKQALAKAMRNLDPIDREILILTYGLDDGNEKSFSKVAALVHETIPFVSNSVSRSLRVLADTKELSHIHRASLHSRNNEVLSSGEIVLTPSKEVYAIYDCLDYDVDTDPMYL